MSTKKPTPKEEPKKALTTTPTAGAVALPDYGEMAGEGMENMTAQDQAVPFIRVLQALSPEVHKKDSKIPGAQAGMFIDTVTKQLHTEVVFVPCMTEHLWVEWKQRGNGGGFVGRHTLHSGIDKNAKKNEKGRMILPNGNEIVETFYVAALLLDDADATSPSGCAMLAFTSTGIGPYKKSIGEIRKIPNVPLFGFILQATTEEQTNADGTWANWKIMPARQPEGDPVFRNGIVASAIDPRGPQAGLLEAARKFYKDVQAGQANIAYDSQAPSGTDKGSDDQVF